MKQIKISQNRRSGMWPRRRFWYQENVEPVHASRNIANPATVYAQQRGYGYQIRSDAQGNYHPGPKLTSPYQGMGRPGPIPPKIHPKQWLGRPGPIPPKIPSEQSLGRPGPIPIKRR